MNAFWIAIALSFHVSAPSQAANLYARDASQFEKYVHRLAPGDTLQLHSGEEEWRDVNLVFEGEGEPGRPIVLAAKQPGGTVFTGKSKLRILGKHLVVDGLVFRDGELLGGSVIAIGSGRGASAQDCQLTNTAVIDYNPADRNVNYKWVSVYGKRNRVDHCYFKGQDHIGQSVVVWLNGEPSDHRIDHNFFAGRPRLGQNGGETVRVGTSARSMENSRTVIEDNLFQDCDGEAEIISIKSCENIVRRNSFVACSGALTLRHGNRNRVEGNWFVGNGKARSGGVRVIGEDHIVINNHFEDLSGRGGRSAISIMNGVPDAPLTSYWQVKGGLIAHNTLIDCASPFDIGFGAGGRGRTLPPTGMRIAANLVKTTGKEEIVVRDASANVEWAENVWAGEGEPGIGGFFRRELAFTKGRLLSSPDTYTSLNIPVGEPSVMNDIDGQPRKGGVAGSDVGADTPVRHTPPTPRSVGPEWMR